jgi:hypothetical protein
MIEKYWEREQPVMADTGRNILRLFESAGKLQVSMPYWIDTNGEQKPGKTITLDVGALLTSPEALDILRRMPE